MFNAAFPAFVSSFPGNINSLYNWIPFSERSPWPADRLPSEGVSAMADVEWDLKIKERRESGCHGTDVRFLGWIERIGARGSTGALLLPKLMWRLL